MPAQPSTLQVGLGRCIAVATAMALAPLTVEPDTGHMLVTAFLTRWESAIDRHKGRARRC